ncbi:hypothetical protein ZWY2020_055054 [Hordeum vulgare]|nr:hypothetical protein ZWY2020_055054 [Hordeum vulgare]
MPSARLARPYTSRGRCAPPPARAAAARGSSAPTSGQPPPASPPRPAAAARGTFAFLLRRTTIDARAQGCAQSIIVAERVVLNFMQRMSGIARMTKAMADAARPACILETRKTAPDVRLVDKWAVLIGGGKNHRPGLFDMVIIKDNHISVAGGITNAMTS